MKVDYTALGISLSRYIKLYASIGPDTLAERKKLLPLLLLSRINSREFYF